MTLFVLHPVAQDDYICTTDTLELFDELRKQGCRVFSEDDDLDSLGQTICATDVLMVHITARSDRAINLLSNFNGKKALFTIDESKSDGVLFRTQMELCEKIGCKSIVLSYPSIRNKAFLAARGYTPVWFLPSTTVRERVGKTHDILISGQLDHSYYPTRTRLAHLIQQNAERFGWSVTSLPHPGFSRSRATHPYHGEAYKELLDRHRFAIACKAGWRDRLVAKFVEAGASWCLPIGDRPSYMNDGMSMSMLNVDVMSDETILHSIDHVLKHELEDRICEYVETLRQRHDLSRNVAQLIESLTKDV